MLNHVPLPLVATRGSRNDELAADHTRGCDVLATFISSAELVKPHVADFSRGSFSVIFNHAWPENAKKERSHAWPMKATRG